MSGYGEEPWLMEGSTLPPSPRPPRLLAFDTATAYASVALFDGERVLAETTWLAGREHSTRLLVEIERTLERAGVDVTDLTGLVVAHGPGSFTGLRVALSVVKGIAAGLDLPTWGIGTLDVLAHAAQATHLPVRVVLEMGRGRYATALYPPPANFSEQPPAPTITAHLSAADLAALAAEQPSFYVIGDLTPEVRAALAGTAAHLLSPAASLRRASLLAELGWQAHRAGHPGHPSAVDAVYLSR